jgi:hypothetical protein
MFLCGPADMRLFGHLAFGHCCCYCLHFNILGRLESRFGIRFHAVSFCRGGGLAVAGLACAIHWAPGASGLDLLLALLFAPLVLLQLA